MKIIEKIFSKELFRPPIMDSLLLQIRVVTDVYICAPLSTDLAIRTAAKRRKKRDSNRKEKWLFVYDLPQISTILDAYFISSTARRRPQFRYRLLYRTITHIRPYARVCFWFLRNQAGSAVLDHPVSSRSVHAPHLKNLKPVGHHKD